MLVKFCPQECLEHHGNSSWAQARVPLCVAGGVLHYVKLSTQQIPLHQNGSFWPVGREKLVTLIEGGKKNGKKKIMQDCPAGVYHAKLTTKHRDKYGTFVKPGLSSSLNTRKCVYSASGWGLESSLRLREHATTTPCRKQTPKRLAVEESRAVSPCVQTAEPVACSAQWRRLRLLDSAQPNAMATQVGLVSRCFFAFRFTFSVWNFTALVKCEATRRTQEKPLFNRLGVFRFVAAFWADCCNYSGLNPFPI